MTQVQPKVGHWLYASCSALYYGEIIAVGQDANGQPTIDIRVEYPNDLIWCESIDMGAVAGPDDFENPLTTMELPEGVKPILRHVLWHPRGEALIRCNTPGDGCYRCTKLFKLEDARRDLPGGDLFIEAPAQNPGVPR